MLNFGIDAFSIRKYQVFKFEASQYRFVVEIKFVNEIIAIFEQKFENFEIKTVSDNETNIFVLSQSCSSHNIERANKRKQRE